jgi:hypothetical protein
MKSCRAEAIRLIFPLPLCCTTANRFGIEDFVDLFPTDEREFTEPFFVDKTLDEERLE